jgi:hypothetical protein
MADMGTMTIAFDPKAAALLEKLAGKVDSLIGLREAEQAQRDDLLAVCLRLETLLKEAGLHLPPEVTGEGRAVTVEDIRAATPCHPGECDEVREQAHEDTMLLNALEQAIIERAIEWRVPADKSGDTLRSTARAFLPPEATGGARVVTTADIRAAVSCHPGECDEFRAPTNATRPVLREEHGIRYATWVRPGLDAVWKVELEEWEDGTQIITTDAGGNSAKHCDWQRFARAIQEADSRAIEWRIDRAERGAA